MASGRRRCRGGDLYILKDVLHNWNQKGARTILRRCREAMVDGAKLLIIESVMRPGNAPDRVKLLDLHMLVMHGGRERTAAEIESLLAVADLRLTRVLPAGSASILEAVAG